MRTGREGVSEVFVFKDRKTPIAALGAVLVFGGTGFALTEGNDYPTEAVADYVFGCMKANGETREALLACSCSADVVASLVPYERYEEASTFLSMQQATGEGAALFRETAEARAAIQDVRRAQAEADVRCFRSAN